MVLASPGFLQSGPSRELLEYWAPDPRNGLIITGYSIEGTLARVSGGWNGSNIHCFAHSFCIVLLKCDMFPPALMPEGLLLILITV